MTDSSQIYNLVTLLLAEKRTSLAVLRTGIAIFTLPLSVFTVLIATSKFYDVPSSLHFIIPLLIICGILIHPHIPYSYYMADEIFTSIANSSTG